MRGPEILIPLGFFAMVTTITVGMPLVKAIAKKWEREGTRQFTSDGEARLERMEQSIDAIAIEVERIAEGQRFTTKLLSERAGTSPDSPNEPISRIGGSR